MKKTIIAIIIYFLMLHVLLPGAYYLCNGFMPIYSDFENRQALIKSFFLICIPLIITIFILRFLPKRNDIISPNIDGKPVTFLFYFSILLKLVILFTTGGFAAAISGETNGTVSNYISLFFNPFTLLLVLLFVQKKRSNIVIAILFYVLSVTLSGSRSGIITIFFVFFIGYTFEIFKIYQKKLSNFLKYSIFLTPIIFIFATKLRGVDEVFSLDFLLNQIVGRMSVLETSMLPVYYYDNNLNLELFYDKFSFWNQLKLIIDGILPGQIFDFDVMPNNYYRAMFLDYSESFVFDNYMSVNLTLPIYLYLKYSYFSIIFCVMYVLGFYKLTLLLKRYPLFVIILLSVFYNILYFFDWDMVFSQLYISFLTITFLKFFILFKNSIETGIIKNRINEIKY
jgi:hypothetical protein